MLGGNAALRKRSTSPALGLFDEDDLKDSADEPLEWRSAALVMLASASAGWATVVALGYLVHWLWR